MNHHHPVTEEAILARAAEHLMQNFGSRAAAIAAKRATYLEQCGEVAGADTWHKIGGVVRNLEARADRDVGARETPARDAPPRPEPLADGRRTGISRERPRAPEATAQIFR